MRDYWQTRKQARKRPRNRNEVVATLISMEISPAQKDVKEKLAEELSKIRMGEAQDFTSPAKLEDKQQSDYYGTGGGVADPRLLITLSTNTSGVERSLKKGLCCTMIRV